MKKILPLVLCLLISSLSFAQVSSGLIAWWPFNGNAQDFAGTHHGNTKNITYSAGRSGTPNTAAYFNGSSTSYITTGYQSDLNLTRMSICAIVKPTAFYTDICQSSRILSRGPDYVNGHYQLELFNNAYDSSCTITGDTSYYTFNVGFGNKSKHPKIGQYSPLTRTNSWYCVVTTWDDTVYRMYVDGVLKFQATPYSNPPIGTSTDSLSIGGYRYSATYPYWFKGYMDDLRLYNRALTTAEIDSLCGILYIDSNNPTSFCPDQTFNLKYNTTITYYAPGNVFTAELSDAFGSFASPTVIGSVTSTTSGTIPCTMSASPGTGYKIRVVSTMPAGVSDVLSITVNNTIPPTVTISASPSTGVGKGAAVTYTATVLNGGTGPAYQWLKNGIAIPGATSSTYTAIAGIDFFSGDNISVHVKSNNQCSNPDTANSNVISMDIKMGISKYASNDIFYVYPNPNKGAFTLKGKTDVKNNIEIQVLNTMGQVIYTDAAAVERGEVNKTISLNNVSAGLYYIRLYSDGSTQTIKTTVE